MPYKDTWGYKRVPDNKGIVEPVRGVRKNEFEQLP